MPNDYRLVSPEAFQFSSPQEKQMAQAIMRSPSKNIKAPTPSQAMVSRGGPTLSDLGNVSQRFEQFLLNSFG